MLCILTHSRNSCWQINQAGFSVVHLDDDGGVASVDVESAQAGEKHIMNCTFVIPGTCVKHW